MLPFVSSCAVNTVPGLSGLTIMQCCSVSASRISHLLVVTIARLSSSVFGTLSHPLLGCHAAGDGNCGRLWPLGHSLIGDLVPGSINYVCRYNLKKITGEKADEWYKGRMPEFVRCSNRPGIGADWLDSFYGDIYKVDLFTERVLRDSARYQGKECRPPRYYDRLIRADKPGLWEAISSARASFAEAQDLPTVSELRNAETHAQAVARHNLMSKQLSRFKKGVKYV